MKHYRLHLMIGVLVALALAACQSSAPAPTNAPGSEGDLETKGFVESGDGRLRVIGKGQLLVSLRIMNNPPAAPVGWELVAPAFDITAQDR